MSIAQSMKFIAANLLRQGTWRVTDSRCFLRFRLDGGNLANSQPIDLSGADPNLIKHIDDLQEQLVVERKKNWKLKGT
jgi:hypothetical protein